ncbi:hypothetical protein HYU19_00165, partial [Candidatus Woesearchaeota archaeon]|nr:hypothetical protein [Candidatus Woesearchaeota archaeon]
AEFPEQLLHLTVYFVRLLRESDKVERKPGVRATIGLYQRAQALAALLGKKCVSWDDVAAVAPSVLAYRMTLKPSVQYLQSPEEFVQDELKRFAQLNRIELPAQETGDGP